jgi:DNA-directed RNA polymerase subunit F
VGALNRRVLSRKYLSLSEALSLLENRMKEEPPLITEQEKTWDYLRSFGRGDPEKARKAVEELEKMGLGETVSVNIVNICPSTPGEVRAVLAMRKDLSYDEELVSRILEAIRDYCSE